MAKCSLDFLDILLYDPKLVVESFNTKPLNLSNPIISFN
jgi:hypothetical protein